MAVKHTWSKIPFDTENIANYVEVTHIKSGMLYTIHVGPTGDGVRNRYFCCLTVMGYESKRKQQIPTPTHREVVKPFLIYATDIRKAKEQALNNLRAWAKGSDFPNYNLLENLI